LIIFLGDVRSAGVTLGQLGWGQLPWGFNNNAGHAIYMYIIICNLFKSAEFIYINRRIKKSLQRTWVRKSFVVICL
jgi:hypothetical protein